MNKKLHYKSMRERDKEEEGGFFFKEKYAIFSHLEKHRCMNTFYWIIWKSSDFNDKALSSCSYLLCLFNCYIFICTITANDSKEFSLTAFISKQ